MCANDKGFNTKIREIRERIASCNRLAQRSTRQKKEKNENWDFILYSSFEANSRSSSLLSQNFIKILLILHSFKVLILFLSNETGVRNLDTQITSRGGIAKDEIVEINKNIDARTKNLNILT